MRHYPQNSPHAGARILALAALSDGNLSKIEVDTLDHLKAHDQLGMERSEMLAVMGTL